MNMDDIIVEMSGIPACNIMEDIKYWLKEGSDIAETVLKLGYATRKQAEILSLRMEDMHRDIYDNVQEY